MRHPNAVYVPPAVIEDGLTDFGILSMAHEIKLATLNFSIHRVPTEVNGDCPERDEIDHRSADHPQANVALNPRAHSARCLNDLGLGLFNAVHPLLHSLSPRARPEGSLAFLTYTKSRFKP